MQHSVIKQLKTQLLSVVLEKQPEASVEIFAMAAMHGDIESLDMIIDKVGDQLGTLDEMTHIRDSLALILKDLDAAEAIQQQAEAQAAKETQDLMRKLGL